MKKAITIMSVLLAFINFGFAQNSTLMDSLRHELSIATNDTSRARLMYRISRNYIWNRPDSSIFYANKGLAIARKINSPELEVNAMIIIGLSHINLGNDARALQINLKAIKIGENNDMLVRKPGILLQSGRIYNMSKNYSKALNSFRKVKAIADSTHNNFFRILAPSYMSQTFIFMSQLDSALYWGHLADDYAQKLDKYNPFPKYFLGEIYFEKGNNKLALKYLHEALLLANDTRHFFNSSHKIAQVYHQMGMPDSSIYYANKALEISLESKIYSNIVGANILLSEIYEKWEPEKALQYSKSSIAYNDTLDFIRKKTTMEDLTSYDAQERQYEIEQAEIVYKNRIQKLWIFSIAGALLSALFVAFILFRNNKNKQKANALLKEQKEEIQVTLEKLESSQTQLIQSEKMASLGELTAGIAHEIQNPLNFVNNFSEVNRELISELKEEVEKGDLEEIKVIADDIEGNEEKINHHGKRAESIVKSMLEHSRTSSGQKELMDINILVDEHLRLAYHGFRAKDKSFNADFKTEFDESLPKINVIPQDIGRVLLNLINNAFFAVDKKSKEGIDGYKPVVIISTKKHSKSIEISVKDNGTGIPSDIKEKIFQPFFTTKPTGQGTGLGLSLSHDIIKAHGGEIKLESLSPVSHDDQGEGLPSEALAKEGAEFIIIIPLTT